MTSPRPLTPKQQRFVEEYLVDLNATAATVRAGYSKVSAGKISTQLLGKTGVASAIAAAKAKRTEKLEITADWIIDQWAAIVKADPSDLSQLRRGACSDCWNDGKDVPDRRPNAACSICDGEGVPRLFIPDTRTLSPYAKALFAGVKQTKGGLEVLTRDRDAALANLAKAIGVLVDRTQHLDRNGKPTDAPTPVLNIFIEGGKPKEIEG